VFGNLDQLRTQLAEDMIVFYLFFQPSDLLGAMEPAALGFSFLFTGIQGIGAGQNRVFLSFESKLQELTDDRSPAHVLDRGDMAEQFLPDLTEM
jgi:hypothetical protein